MKTFCLREVYDTSNLGFSTEVTLFEGRESAYLIKTRTLPMISCESNGISEDGRKEIQTKFIDRTFQGNPLLLELIATEEDISNLSPLAMRRKLEDRITKLLGLLTWSLPGVIGPKLGDALFSRTEKNEPNEWDMDDCTPFTIPCFFAEPEAAKEICTANEKCLEEQEQDNRERIIRAMRWWRVGGEATSQVDRFIAFWITIETCSKNYAGENAEQVRKLLKDVFPKLTEDRICRVSRNLHGARSKVAHNGYRELRDIDTLTEFAAYVAKAAIQYLLSGQTSQTPAALLDQLGI